MKKLVICKGLPASGKSLWAREFVKGKKDWVRINNDELGAMVFGELFARNRGDLLDKIRLHMVDWFMNLGYNIVVDNTNLHPKQEVYYRTIVEERNFAVQCGEKLDGYEFSIKDFTDVSVNECLVRNRARENPVPDKVIYQMYNSYLKTTVAPLVQDKILPKALVVDLDGTMSLVNSRSPHDLTKVYSDDVNEPIVDLVKMMHNGGHKIIFISGREEICRHETIRWLKDKAGFEMIPYDLHLRPDDDKRPDTQYKKDIFEQELKGKFYVTSWIEDRWRMCNAVRNELGITCLQCADGHF